MKIRYIMEREVEELVLNYIRKNIYSKYPKKSLQTSYLLQHISINAVEKDKHGRFNKLTNGLSKLIFHLNTEYQYELYFKDDLLATLDYMPKMTCIIK